MGERERVRERPQLCNEALKKCPGSWQILPSTAELYGWREGFSSSLLLSPAFAHTTGWKVEKYMVVHQKIISKMLFSNYDKCFCVVHSRSSKWSPRPFLQYLSGMKREPPPLGVPSDTNTCLLKWFWSGCAAAGQNCCENCRNWIDQTDCFWQSSVSCRSCSEPETRRELDSQQSRTLQCHPVTYQSLLSAVQNRLKAGQEVDEALSCGHFWLNDSKINAKGFCEEHPLTVALLPKCPKHLLLQQDTCEGTDLAADPQSTSFLWITASPNAKVCCHCPQMYPSSYFLLCLG